MGKGQELLDAARNGDIAVVEKILTKRSGPFPSIRRGPGVNVQDSSGYTPLHHAALNGHKEIVRLLLAADASPCVVDQKGASPLHMAAWAGHSDIVRALLANHNPPVNVDLPTANQETALHCAAQFGHVEVVAQLLARGADVHVRNKRDETALDLAAQFGRLETVQHLLHMRPQLVDPYRAPASMVRLFSHTPLHRASKNGHDEVVSTLIAAGVDPNVRTAGGTALHEAAFLGKAKCVRALLHRGAELDARDRRDRTVRDLLADFPPHATQRVRHVIDRYLASRVYGSDEELPAIPVENSPLYENSAHSVQRARRSPSDMYDDERRVSSVSLKPPETPNLSNHTNIQSSSPSSVTLSHPQNFVQKLASKCLGFKAKFNSTPNISSSGLEAEVTMKSKSKNVPNRRKENSTSTIHIGNSKFFKKLKKKDDSCDVVCNDEFDTISLDRLVTLERVSVINRSNRSCPGFEMSLPNISENTEISDSFELVAELGKCDEPPDKLNTIEVVEAFNLNGLTLLNCNNNNGDNESSLASVVNDCYEPYNFSTKSNTTLSKNIVKPAPRNFVNQAVNSTIYENVVVDTGSVVPKPAARTTASCINVLSQINILDKSKSDNSLVLIANKGSTPKVIEVLKPGLVVDIIKTSDQMLKLSNTSLNSSKSSTSSYDSMLDGSNFEDILLSKKSKSFKHTHKLELYTGPKLSVQRTTSVESDSSSGTYDDDLSPIENVDCSTDLDLQPDLLKTGTLPTKKGTSTKKKVLFRNKTFSTLVTGTDSKIKKTLPFLSNIVQKENANYHIRGTGHCIYEAPTVQEFINIFNRDSFNKDDFKPSSELAKKYRDSNFETAICFCKPTAPKHHRSADDLLRDTNLNSEPSVGIDMESLIRQTELLVTSFCCYCDDETCKFHQRKRDTPVDLVVKFSALSKSMSTPDISLASNVLQNKSEFASLKTSSDHESHYAVVDVVDILARSKIYLNNTSTSLSSESKTVPFSSLSESSTLSSSLGRPYSVKDVSDGLSMHGSHSTSSNNTSLTFGASSENLTLFPTRKGSIPTELLARSSFVTCRSDSVTYRSDGESFRSCMGTSDSDTDTMCSFQGTSRSSTLTSGGSRGWLETDSLEFDNGVSKADVPRSRDGVPSGEGPRELDVASLDGGVRARGCVRSGSGRARRWDEAGDGTSEGDALSVSSAASGAAPLHLAHHHDFNKVSPTPPKKPPRRNLSVSPTHASSPGYGYELRSHARSQDDLDDKQGAKQYLKHGRSVDQYVDGKHSYPEYEENHNSPRVVPVPNPRPSLKNRAQPVAISAMYENVVVKEQNPRRKLRRNNFTHQYENFDPSTMTEARIRKLSAQERSSLESLLDDAQSMNSPSDCERYVDGVRVQIPLSPTHYEQPPTPEHPPPSARQAERSIHERIRPLSQLIMEVVEEIRTKKKLESKNVAES